MPAPAPSPPVRRRGSSAGSGHQVPRRVLVVDDDRRMASTMAQWLCSQGWHAHAAGSPDEAITALGRGRLEGCLLDADLPDGGSQRVAAVLRAAWPAARLIAFSAAATSATPRLAADVMLTAPLEDAAVLAALSGSSSSKQRW